MCTSRPSVMADDCGPPVERSLAHILDTLSERVCLYAVDDLTIRYCNAAWAAGHDASPEELIGHCLDELLSPEELDALKAQLELLGPSTPILENGEPVPAPDAPDRWLSWVDHYLPLDRGPEVLAVGRDATAQHHAKLQLQASEARFRELADRSADIVWRFVMDPFPHFDYLSPSVEKLTGYSAVELQADLDRFLEVIDDEEGLALIIAALDGEPLPERYDMRFRRADGTVMVGEVQTTLLSNGVQGVCRDVTEIRALQTELARQALRDPLTGLANRRLLDELLDAALRRVHRSGDLVSVIYVDLDGFKAVNDRLGHAAGDRVLAETARRLTGVVRDSDVVARLGGDEFIVVMETPDPVATAVLERIDRSLAAPIELDDGSTIRCRASIGLADTGSVERESTALIAAADSAMYIVKRERAATSRG